jgi:hypothetical protein
MVRHGSSSLSNMGNPRPRSNTNSRLSSMRHDKHVHHSSINSTNNRLHHSLSLRRLSTFSMTHLT